MGCDIHMYPEYRKVGRDHWQSLARRMNPGRDYDLFNKIAGLRGDGEPVLPVRGMPANPSMMTKWENELFISDEGGEECCTTKQAEQWITSGSSQYVDERKKSVTHPDWHSHTWLTSAEFRQILELPREIGWNIDVAYWGLLAMLEEIDRRAQETRIVIWFDN